MHNPDDKTVSIRDIAKVVGCSHSTVGRALSGQRRVNNDLKEKILSTADEMGYKRNPMVSSLMAAQKSKRKRSELTANICWLNTHINKNFWNAHPYTQNYKTSAERRAKQLGYGFDEIWGFENGLNGKRLTQIAHSRGIRGFIISGPLYSQMLDGFKIDEFSFACIKDKQSGQADWHRSSISERQNITHTFRKLRSYGYQRIALALASSNPFATGIKQEKQFNKGRNREFDLPINEGFKAALSGYMYCLHFISKKDRINPYIYNRTEADYTKQLGSFLKKNKVDAVICFDADLAIAAKEAHLKIPEDIAIAHNGLSDDVENWAGITPFSEYQSTAAVDLVTAQIERNERGIPSFPKQINIKGVWHDGWTAPNLKA